MMNVGTRIVSGPQNAYDAPALRVGFYALLAWVFVYFSRILDVTIPNFKIPMLLNTTWLAAAIVSGGIALLLGTRVGLLFAAFTVWVACAVPFSVWKGGSMETLTLTFRSLTLLMAILALVRTSRACIQVMFTIGYAMFVAAVVSRFTGELSVTGRLVVSSGSFSDPNYYCIILVAGMPFLLLKSSVATNPFTRLLPLALLVPMFIAALKTGSRSGFVALCGMLVVYFVRSSWGRRAAMVGSLVVVGALVSVLAPGKIVSRYSTLFSAGAGETASGVRAAASSANARSHLFWRSIELTIANPLFGVGPGMFAVAESEDAKAQGGRGAWHETHNTYSQVSSEIGVPGLLLYASALVTALLSLSRVCKIKSPGTRGWEPVRQAAIHLQMSMIAALVGAMFLSMAYNGLLFLLSGLTIAFYRSVESEFPELLRSRNTASVQLYNPGPRRRQPAAANVTG
jgi:O-antigen ligase